MKHSAFSLIFRMLLLVRAAEMDPLPNQALNEAFTVNQVYQTGSGIDGVASLRADLDRLNMLIGKLTVPAFAKTDISPPPPMVPAPLIFQPIARRPPAFYVNPIHLQAPTSYVAAPFAATAARNNQARGDLEQVVKILETILKRIRSKIDSLEKGESELKSKLYDLSMKQENLQQREAIQRTYFKQQMDQITLRHRELMMNEEALKKKRSQLERLIVDNRQLNS